MYKPTKEELEEMGFKQNNFSSAYTLQVGPIPHTIKYEGFDEWRVVISGDNVGDRDLSPIIYPQSKEEIQTLIRIFTPHK